MYEYHVVIVGPLSPLSGYYYLFTLVSNSYGICIASYSLFKYIPSSGEQLVYIVVIQRACVVIPRYLLPLDGIR